MELANTVLVPAPPDAVWAALNDPAVLRACVPGCESLEKVADNEYRAAMTARVGPVSAKFTGRMTMTDIDAPRGYTLRFEGQGGPAGFASGDARVSLAPAEGGQTSMTYAATAQVGGKLAQIGSRLIDGAASKLANDFFARFIAHFAAPLQSPPVETASAAGQAAGNGDTLPARVSERGTWTRFVAIAAIIVILAYLYFKGGRIH
jgi:carbon monoxide dehydrogenase subunit G